MRRAIWTNVALSGWLIVCHTGHDATCSDTSTAPWAVSRLRNCWTDMCASVRNTAADGRASTGSVCPRSAAANTRRSWYGTIGGVNDGSAGERTIA